MSRLFISHSSKDNVAAIAFKQWLAANDWPAEEVFLDLESIGAGERWKEALRKANARCEAVILLASPHALSSPECIAEVRKAEDFGKEIIVVLLHDLTVDDRRLDSFKERQIVDLSAPPQAHIENVAWRGEPHEIRFNPDALARVKDYLVRRGITPDLFAWPPKDKPDADPFPGLSPFTEDDAGIFFGRDADILRGLDRIRVLRRKGGPQLIVIQAASGAGKSSFLRAGLWPRLARDPDFATIALLRPVQGILTGPEGLGRKLAALLSRPRAPVSPGDIHRRLTAGGDDAAAGEFLQLMKAIAADQHERRRIGDANARPPALVLAIDQAEELFAPEEAVESRLFLHIMAKLMQGRPAGAETLVLFTIRADGAASLFQTIADLGLELPETLPLLPLPQTSYRDVIMRPLDILARRGQRLTIDVALADRLVADSKGADALPLLAFTLSHLYQEFAPKGRIGFAEYKAVGEIAGSIDLALKQALAKPADDPAIPPGKEEQLTLLRSTFIPWLARIDPEGGEPMRRTARLHGLPERNLAMVRRLVRARLLVLDRQSGADVAEVAHESLLRQWPTLSGWLKEESEGLKLLEEVKLAASKWVGNGRLDIWIDHRAERLYLAEALAARDDFRRLLDEDGVEYLRACRNRECRAFRLEGSDLLPLGLDRAGLGAASYAWPPPREPTRPPYRGLRSLEADDAGVFFGRDADVLRGLERVRRLIETRSAKLLIILGSSGVGKSSFLQAGLWPRLAQQPAEFVALPVVRVTDDSHRVLAAALATAFDHLGNPRDPDEIRASLAAGASGFFALAGDLVRLTKRELKVEESDPTVILSLDQADQLFVRRDSPEIRNLLADILREAEAADRRVLMILTVRSDSYQLLESDAVFSSARQDLFNLPPLGEDQLRDVIARPAARCSAQFEPPTLSLRLAADAARENALPLLAYLLENIWLTRAASGDGILRLQHELGGILGIVAERAETFVAEHAESIDKLRRLFVFSLAAVDPDGQVRRRLCRLTDLALAERQLVMELAADPYRLVVISAAQATGEVTAEVAHEAIFHGWGRLRGWMAEEREFLAWRNDVQRAQRAWEMASPESRDSALLAGFALDQARGWLPEHAEFLSSQEREFIDHSIRLADFRLREARLVRLRIRRTTVAAAVLILILGAGVIGWVNQDYLQQRYRDFFVSRPYLQAQVLPFVLSPAAERSLSPGDAFSECARACPVMIVLSAGEFVMGSPAPEPGRFPNEGPQHVVRIERPFAVSKFDVTFDDWDACAAYGDCDHSVNDAGFGRGTRPVINVTWEDAKTYVAWLSKVSGRPYRLLSEAEYEYAARGGSATAFPWGEDLGTANANCDGCGSQWDGQKSAPTGSFPANRFGLYDMVGNIGKWVEDCDHEDYVGAPVDGSAWIIGGECSRRVVRGGSWISAPRSIRSASRDFRPFTGRNSFVGFRIARTLSP